MKRLIIRLLTALLTFTIGLAVSTLLVAYRRPVVEPVKVELKQPPESQSITFEDGHSLSVMTFHWFYSSDNVGLRYGCFDYESLSGAAQQLRQTNFVGQRIVERTPKLNDKGERVGERVIVFYPFEYDPHVRILWTEGTRQFEIISPTLNHALEFEKSQVWVGKGCLPGRARRCCTNQESE